MEEKEILQEDKLTKDRKIVVLQHLADLSVRGLFLLALVATISLEGCKMR